MIDLNQDEEVVEQSEEEKEQTHKNNLLAYGDLFHQLMQHERFQRFFACNYTVNVVKDDEKHEVRTVVLEIPDDEVQQKLMDLFKTPAGEAEIAIPTAAEISKISG